MLSVSLWIVFVVTVADTETNVTAAPIDNLDEGHYMALNLTKKTIVTEITIHQKEPENITQAITQDIHNLTKSKTENFQNDIDDVDYMGQGKAVVQDFFARYSHNTTKEVDLVFVLDRSGSVPRKGWHSMLNFVKDLLEHFTVDAENTRVAIITYSTKATVDINDLKPGPMTDRENKCTLMRRIGDYIERKIPYGYTATYEALNEAYKVILASRPNAKKAIFVLTDGKSNIGAPPVKIAVDIVSLQWDESWQADKHGPQVEIYALGVEKAHRAELTSMATNLPHHVFLIPNFQKFEQLARSLHGGKNHFCFVFYFCICK